MYDVLGVEQAVSAFVSYGSTAPEQVAEQTALWKKKLSLEPADKVAARSAKAEVAS